MDYMDYEAYIRYAIDLHYDGYSKKAIYERLLERKCDKEKAVKISEMVNKLYIHNKRFIDNSLKKQKQLEHQKAIQKRLLIEEEDRKRRLKERNADDYDMFPPIY